ncbi:MAG: hypothetical protein JST18_11815 [Bacteroidetes bacterium]|nr:hypothetical protein [Bacteroidota bacterium]
MCFFSKPLSFDEILVKIRTNTYDDDNGWWFCSSSRLQQDLPKFARFSLDQKVQIVVELNLANNELWGSAIDLLNLGKDGEVKLANALIKKGNHRFPTDHFKHLKDQEIQQLTRTHGAFLRCISSPPPASTPSALPLSAKDLVLTFKDLAKKIDASALSQEELDTFIDLCIEKDPGALIEVETELKKAPITKKLDIENPESLLAFFEAPNEEWIAEPKGRLRPFTPSVEMRMRLANALLMHDPSLLALSLDNLDLKRVMSPEDHIEFALLLTDACPDHLITCLRNRSICIGDREFKNILIHHIQKAHPSLVEEFTQAIEASLAPELLSESSPSSPKRTPSPAPISNSPSDTKETLPSPQPSIPPAISPGGPPPPPPPPPPVASPSAPKLSLKDQALEKAKKIRDLHQKIEAARAENLAAQKRIREINQQLATLGQEQSKDPLAAIALAHKEIQEKKHRLNQLEGALTSPENEGKILQLSKEISHLETRKNSFQIAKALREKKLLEQEIKEAQSSEKEHREQISAREQQIALLSKKIALGSPSLLTVNGKEMMTPISRMQTSKRSIQTLLMDHKDKHAEVQQRMQEKFEKHNNLHQQHFTWNGKEYALEQISALHEEFIKEKQTLEQACARRDLDKKTWQTALARLERVQPTDQPASALKRTASAPGVSLDTDQLKLRALERALETGQIDHLA